MIHALLVLALFSPRAQGVAKTGTALRTEVAIFAGGCFWGIDAVYKHTKGVVRVVSGFADAKGGSGGAGHAESVEVTYDPAETSYAQLLEIFFLVAHDPTQLNRQGPDVGPEYRSAIFYRSPEQERQAREYIQQLTEARQYTAPIVTQVAQLDRFVRAGPFHQDYLARHMTDPYIVYNDLPKLKRLEERFPDRYRAASATSGQ